MVVITSTGTYRLKIVLYGPSLSGKTVLLNKLYEIFSGKKSRIYSIEEPSGRTLFFDYLVVQPRDYDKFAFDIYTVPGQKRHARQRRIILNGADCIVFVADSDPQALIENAYSFEELRRYIGGVLHRIPLIIAVNKRDLTEALPIRVILRAMKLDRPAPVFPIIAIEGVGIREMFREALRLTMLARFFPTAYRTELERVKMGYKHLLPREVIYESFIKV